MDLSQVKLNKTEWDSIESPVSENERFILNMIVDGYSNIDIKSNQNKSIISFLGIESTNGIDEHIYNEYFKKTIKNIDDSLVETVDSKKLKKADLMRFNLNRRDAMREGNVYEDKLIDLIREIVILSSKSKPYHRPYFILYKLMKYNIPRVNTMIVKCANTVLQKYEKDMLVDTVYDAKTIFETNKQIVDNEDVKLFSHQKDIFRITQNPEFQDNQKAFIECKEIVNDPDIDLDNKETVEAYNHAKSRLKELASPATSKLILYSAPTGTGKTLTPIALANNYRIIFVCAARHVGLALARSAISMGKKVAFAFGCSSASDVRLHYSAASVYERHRKTGGVFRVDNTVGDKVEIIICDLRSYICAMNYMKSFNPVVNILTYWDEPTISLDYPEHPLHEHIHNLWTENMIPNIVMSSATLPAEHEITDTVGGFIQRFPNAQIHSITSTECKKSIPVVNKNGYNVMPHFLKNTEDYEHVKMIAESCLENLTLLRYLDLQECIDFIRLVNENNYIVNSKKLQRYFTELGHSGHGENILENVTPVNIKRYYLECLCSIQGGTWGAVCTTLKVSRKQVIELNGRVDETGNELRKTRSIGPGVKLSEHEKVSATSSIPSGDLTRQSSVQPITARVNQKQGSTQPGIYITTKDASTLTDGPTIFIAEDVDKIAKFYLKQSYIPASVLTLIMEKINYNNTLAEKISTIENEIDFIQEKADSNSATESYSASLLTKKKNGKGGKSGKGGKPEKKSSADNDLTETSDLGKLKNELEILYKLIRPAELSEVFVPNRLAHVGRWAANPEIANAYTSDIDEDIVLDIMSLDGVNETWKVLLLMGIGVFTTSTNQSYTEIMKRLASEQKLYLIIASSDYIYGTNYQFCHGYLGKDVVLTKQKIIQAAGRVGRNNINQSYSIRLRDDSQGELLFLPSTNNIEAVNMNRLFAN